MGTCMSNDKPIRSKSARFDIEPADTESLKNVELPILDFYVLISDIKVKKCNMETIGFNFKMEGVTHFNCPLRAVDTKGKTYWKIYHTFDFMMNQYQLRKKFLILEAIGPDNKVQGTLKINIHTIWAGPFHQDFLMNLQNGKSCRVSFNCRISQGIHMKLSNTLTQFIPSDTIINGTRLTFTMEAIMGSKTQPSSFAHHVIVDDKQGFSKGLLGDFPAARNVKKDSIQWKHLQGHEPLPHFNQKIPYYQIYSSSMQFTFWKVQPGIIDPAEPRYQPLGSCYIPLSRLMAMDYMVETDPDNKMKYFKREVDIREKIWYHGRENGLARLQFCFKMQAYQRQMQSCVRTEDGILTSTPVFSNFAGKECEQILKLGEINTQIQKQFINLDQASESGASYMVMRPIITKIYVLLEKQLQLLKQTNKQSIQMYNYSSNDDLMKGQRFLVFFAFKVLAYIRQDIAYLKEMCWQILIAILRRGQFKLSHMAFNEEEKNMMENDDRNDHIKFKREISIKYIELLNELLKETLRSLAFKGNITQQSFAEKFCAYAYFRLPLFRQHILQIIKEQKNPELPQWRGTEVNLYEKISGSTHQDDFYDHLFNWQKKFLKPLMKDERYDNFIHELERQLLQEKWKLRLGKRQIAYYRFIQNLVQEIQYVCVNNKHIKWHCLPGYNQLLHAFLTSMKLKQIAKYSDAFCKCCIKLLANQRLLNVMVVLLLSRSNVNDPNTVAITFELIDEFFKSIKKNQRPIHGTFDFKFLLKGIKIVLQSQFQASISKVLYFIYDNFNIFPQQFSLEISLHLMTVYFYRFFFHWSSNLRKVFQLLVYVKISRYDIIRDNLDIQARNSESGYVTSLRTTLRQRYYSVLEDIRDEIEPQAPTKNIDRFYDKELYKKMVARLKKNKQSNRKGSVSSSRDVTSKSEDKPQKPLFLFPSNREIGQPRSYSTPKKLLYFTEHEMKIQSVKPWNMGYIKIGLREFNEVVSSYKQELKINPKLTPQLDIKKIMDEVDLFEGDDEEW